MKYFYPTSCLFILSLFLFTSCNEQKFSVGECVQKADEIIVYKIITSKNNNYELKNSQTSEVNTFETLNGFIKTSCP